MKEERIELTGDVVAARRDGDFCGKVIVHDAAVGVWYYVNGEYHRLRKSAKNVIRLDSQNSVEIYSYRRTDINGAFANALRVNDGNGCEYPVNLAFVYRIFDLPLFAASKLAGGRRQIDKNTLSDEIVTKDILPFINVNGIKGLSGVDVPREIMEASAGVLNDIRSAGILSHHGIELINLRMSVR